MKIRTMHCSLFFFFVAALVQGDDIDVTERTKNDEIPHSSNDNNENNYEQEHNYIFRPALNGVIEIPMLRPQIKHTTNTARQELDRNGDEVHNPPYNLPIGPEYDNLVSVTVVNNNGTQIVYNDASVYFGMETLDVHIRYGLTPLESIPSCALDKQNRQDAGMMIPRKRNIFDNQKDVLPAKHLVDSILSNNKVMGDIPQFIPLSCNANLDQTKCTSWVSKFGKESIHSDLIVIECGKCYVMDFPGSTLTLKAGIDIVGKLVFPKWYTLKLVTSMIVVQGELKMTSTKEVNGIPDIEVTMIGMEDKFFIARGENKDMCPKSRCLAGKKAITVAGGKIKINGLPDDTPTWVSLFDVAGVKEESVTSIIVDASVQRKWAPGAEILITSHTLDWSGQQENRIVSIVNYGSGSEYVQLNLDNPIVKPTTQTIEQAYAVEVALLSRNIVFKGGFDTVANHGGHLWVQFTPDVEQTLIGVEFQNFGQQGLRGRYPIHFHMNGNATGSIVAKNSVRKSNQRCIVIHGTNNVLVAENIAFDTKGHCFVLEDGIETGNKFVRNLGALTKIPQKLISVDESDDSPATFWITNPRNSFEGNVAAGSEKIGFWIEPLKRGVLKDKFPHLIPDNDPLTQFEGNVAHSNGFKGITTYPTGYEPKVMGDAIFDNVKSYRNNGPGIFFHITRNIIVQNSLIADNKEIGIDIDRADAIKIVNTEIVSQSKSYGSLIKTQGAKLICNFGSVSGMDLHTWKNNADAAGITVQNVRFSGFESNVCQRTIPFKFDDVERTGLFNLYTTLQGLRLDKFASDRTAFHFCEAHEAGIEGIYLNVLDGKIYPSDSTQDVATVTGLSNNMVAFINTNQCQIDKVGCYVLCRKHCISSIRFDIDPANTEDFELKICNQAKNKVCTYWASGILRDVSTQTNVQRTFIAHLPPGTYDASFVDKQRYTIWPTFVLRKDEHTQCHIKTSLKAVVDIDVPFPSPDSCDQLIRNSGMERLEKLQPATWLSRFGSLDVVFRQGMSRSNAISDPTAIALKMVGQFLDSRCLQANVGKYYEVTAFVKVLLRDGSRYRCLPSSVGCPQLGIITRSGSVTLVADIEPETTDEGYQRLNGFVKIDSNFAESQQVFLFVRYTLTKQNVLVDNVSMKIVRDSNLYCNNVILDSGMDGLAARYWQVMGTGSVAIVAKGPQRSNILELITSKSTDGLAYKSFRNIEKDCITPGSKWKISAQIRLVSKSSGGGCSCNIDTTCPMFQILMSDANGDQFLSFRTRKYAEPWKSETFNQFVSTFAVPKLGLCNDEDCSFGEANSWDGSVGPVSVLVRGIPPGCNLHMDAVMLTRN